LAASQYHAEIPSSGRGSDSSSAVGIIPLNFITEKDFDLGLKPKSNRHIPPTLFSCAKRVVNGSSNASVLFMMIAFSNASFASVIDGTWLVRLVSVIVVLSTKDVLIC
jgi:hypothetical protein